MELNVGKLQTIDTFAATYFGSNGWLLEFDEFHILLDPWLVGCLTFPPGKWFFHGKHKEDLPIPQKVDLILLTQGLADHAHPETLEIFSKSIPVIGSNSAIQVAAKLGFKSLHTISAGEVLYIDEIEFKGTSGASVPNLENGYILQKNEFKVYIEPHGFLDKGLDPEKIDVVISPVVDLSIPLIGSFIKGRSTIKDIIRLFSPKYILESTTGGNIAFEGFLNRFIKIKEIGTAHKVELSKSVKFINPITNHRYDFTS